MHHLRCEAWTRAVADLGGPVFAVGDGHGSAITAGLQAHNARRVAQEIADERRETAFLYRHGTDGDPERIDPTGDAGATVRVDFEHDGRGYGHARGRGRAPEVGGGTCDGRALTLGGTVSPGLLDAARDALLGALDSGDEGDA